MSRKVRSELLTVTPTMAAEWLDSCMYKRQRRRADWQVQRLTIEVEKHRFIEGSQIHFGVLNGSYHLLNGQHTLSAIVKSGLPVLLSVLYTTVDTEEELGLIYGRHDRQRSRKPTEAFHGLGLAEKFSLQPPEIDAFGSAIRYVLSGYRRLSVMTNVEVSASTDLAVEMMTQWQDAARLYFECARDAGHGLKQKYRLTPVVAIAIATFHYEPAKEKAADFWSIAAKDDGLHRGDPRKALNDYLRSQSAKGANPVNFMRHVASAWNRWFEKGKLSAVKPGDAGLVGVTIKGTPFEALHPKTQRPAPEQPPAMEVQGELAEALEDMTPRQRGNALARIEASA